MQQVQNNSELLQRVEKALDAIRPYLRTDGGDVNVLGITDDLTVEIELEGACVSCPMSSMTLKAGVEKSILDAIPEIKAVKAVNPNLA